ncbi:hypothetical protein [Acidithiobacillus albertensis]|uniref:hypothetical protein n=1 Tax=Acidithiobacillus albertensis TaxID=119978 RepID=UPI00094B5DDB|nr:hypothetical protein [Acidithiobacillus albertensis]
MNNSKENIHRIPPPGDWLTEISEEFGHFFEDLHDPACALKEAIRILRPSGRLRLFVSNLDGGSNRVFKENSRLLESPCHLIMVSVKSLKQFFLDCGFKYIRQILTLNINWLIYMVSLGITRNPDPEGAQYQDLPEPLMWQTMPEGKKYSGILLFSAANTSPLKALRHDC